MLASTIHANEGSGKVRWDRKAAKKHHKDHHGSECHRALERVSFEKKAAVMAIVNELLTMADYPKVAIERNDHLMFRSVTCCVSACLCVCAILVVPGHVWPGGRHTAAPGSVCAARRRVGCGAAGGGVTRQRNRLRTVCF